MYGAEVRAYQQTDILTADPKRLVLLCYEEAIRNLKVAQERYLSKEYEAKGRALQKALDILAELRESLNLERGGEIARHLETLYSFMIRHLLHSDMRRNIKGFDQVMVMMDILKSAWENAFYPLQRRGEEKYHSEDSPPMISKKEVLISP